MPVFSGTKLALLHHIFDGRLLVLEDCTGKIEGCTFENGRSNLARRVPVKHKSIYAQIDGGAVLVTGLTKVTFRRCTFRNNSSVMCGGAVSLQADPGSRIVFEDCTFMHNRANDTGPAIDVLTSGQRVIIRGCRFRNNTGTGTFSTISMGQISVFPGNDVVVTRSTFQDNVIDVDIRKSKAPAHLSINRLHHVADVTGLKNKKLGRKVLANSLACLLHPGASPRV